MPLFVEQGFHNASVRDILAVLEWNPATLYRYIDAKEDILYLVADHVLKELIAGIDVLLEERDAYSDEDLATLVIDHTIRQCADFRKEIGFVYRESASLRPEHLERIKQQELTIRDRIVSVLAPLLGENHTSIEVLAWDVLIAGHMWCLKGWSLHKSVSLDEYIELQQLVILRALRAAAPSGAPQRPEGKSKSTEMSVEPGRSI